MNLGNSFTLSPELIGRYIMISPDLIFRYLLSILEPNQFGWALIVQPEFIEYARSLTYWIASPEKDEKLMHQQYYVPAGQLMAHEISRRSLSAITDVYTLSESHLRQFFSSLTLLNYILVYDYFLDVVTDDIVKFRQRLRFILNNTPYEIEDDKRADLKKLIINREVNYQSLKNGKKFVPTNRVVDILDFHDKNELIEWLRIRKIKHKLRKFDLYFL